jgi:monoamine oxidase
VIGAGLAGLVAADELASAGREVTVLEARDRVGGRTWSRRLANGATIEMGAEFVLPGNTEVVALAERLGLGLWEKGMRYGRRDPRDGVPVEPAALAAAVTDLGRALGALDGAPTVRELLDSLPIDPAAREAMLARAEISSAASADEAPATALATLAHVDDQPSPSIAGGNQVLSLALADDVRLGDPVARVDWDEDAVALTTEGGHRAEADACVVAVPASVISRIEISPALPEQKRAAFDAVRYGHAAKLFVPLAEPAEPSAVMSVPERYWCWTATGDGGSPMPVVSCFAGSAAALERLEVAAGPGRWLESLAELRPDLALEPAGAVLSIWDDDPWIGGAYSIAPRPEVTAGLIEPLGPLAFAGEHTAGEYHALMEGAIRSGRRAARLLRSS